MAQQYYSKLMQVIAALIDATLHMSPDDTVRDDIKKTKWNAGKLPGCHKGKNLTIFDQNLTIFWSKFADFSSKIDGFFDQKFDVFRSKFRQILIKKRQNLTL